MNEFTPQDRQLLNEVMAALDEFLGTGDLPVPTHLISPRFEGGNLTVSLGVPVGPQGSIVLRVTFEQWDYFRLLDVSPGLTRGLALARFVRTAIEAMKENRGLAKKYHDRLFPEEAQP